MSNLLELNHVSKKFSKSLRRSMLYGSYELLSNFVGYKVDYSKLRKREFWAVDDVTLELRRKQVLGIIGPNGSGKSTLLRIISGIYPPDKGRVSVYGRVAPLIALGVGFHPHLSGIENIFLNGTLLGMSRSEISSKLDAIIEFSEIRDFINAPIAGYSSGMKVRLGFSIATSHNPDIILLDEILAVGDKRFKAKSFKRIQELSDQAGTILISHNMQMLSRICTDIIVMNKGKFVFSSSDVAEGIEYHLSEQEFDESSVIGGDEITIVDFNLISERSQTIEHDKIEFNFLDSLRLEMLIDFSDLISSLEIQLHIYDNNFIIVGESKFQVNEKNIRNGQNTISIEISQLALGPGTYSITINFIDVDIGRAVKKYHAIKYFRVVGDFSPAAPYQLNANWSITNSVESL